MKKEIEKIIKNYVSEYQKENNLDTKWREPIVKFADAKDKMFKELKKVVNEDHLMPEDLLAGAESIIAFFIPFEKTIPETNIKGKYSSKQWASAYIETNTLIGNLNENISKYLKEKGYQQIFKRKRISISFSTSYPQLLRRNSNESVVTQTRSLYSRNGNLRY